MGIKEDYPKLDELLNINSDNLRVLPSFVLIFKNALALSLCKEYGMDNRSVHVGESIEIFKPLKPEGVISYDVKLMDVIDKGKGVLYMFNCKYFFRY